MTYRPSALRRILIVTALLASVAGLTAPGPAAPTAPAPPSAWQPAGWGGGGLFWSAAYDPTRPGVIYMGGDVAGVYKTEDNGKHWRLTNEGLSHYAVYSLAVAPSVPDLVYAGTTGGVCRSTDGGKHWQALPETAKLGIVAQRDKSVRALAVDPTDGNVVYAGTPTGKIFKTGDGGQTWRQVYECPLPGSVSAVAVSPRRPGTVLAATTNGVVVSRDGGTTWKTAAGVGGAASVAISPSDPNVFYAGAGNVYKSVDGGGTWAACGAGIDPKAHVVEVAVSPRDARAVCCIATDGWSGHFYASADGGQTWTEAGRLTPDADADPTLPDDAAKNGGTAPLSKPTNLTISPADPTQMFVSANWRPCASEDGGKTWTERDRGADISVVYDVRFSGPRAYASVMDEGVLTSADDGAHWRQLWPRAWDKNLSGHDWRLAVWNHAGTDRILSTCSPWDAPADEFVVSEDGGQTFTVVHDGLPATRPKANTMWGQGYLRALAPDPNHPKVVYAGMDGDVAPGQSAGGIFKSEDGGLHWHALPNQPPGRRTFFGLAVDPTDSRRLYWGTCGTDGGLYRSDDGGGSWTRVFSQETWIFNVLVTPTGVVYCPGHNLWRSADHGGTWTQLTHDGGGGQIVGLEADPRDEKTLWISSVTWDEGAHGSVRKTTDSGATWTDVTGNLPYHKPLILRFNPATNELWAGGVGLFKIQQ